MKRFAISRFAISRFVSARFACHCAVPVLAYLFVPGSADAQNVGDNFVSPNLPIEYDRGLNTGVLDRPRPEYDAIGILIGGFKLFPKVETAVGYSDNVYDTSAAKVGDAFFSIAPSAHLISNWNQNELSFDAGGSLERFAKQVRRNQDGWYLGGSGRYDVGGTITLSAAARTERAAEPATSAAYPTAALQASEYQDTTAQLTAGYAPGRLKLQLAYNFVALGFDNVQTISSGIISQRNRDAHTSSGTGRTEYALSPATSLFFQANYDRTDYLYDLEPGVANRNSNTYRGLIGASFDISSLIRGSIGVGYIKRNYSSNLYIPIGGISAEARIDYFPSGLTTVTLSGRRIIQDASFVNTGGFINNTIALRADHELLRNLLLDAQVGYEHDQYEGVDASLDIVRIGAGARFIISRKFGLGLALSHDSRSAHGELAGVSYGESRAMLSLVFQK